MAMPVAACAQNIVTRLGIEPRSRARPRTRLGPEPTESGNGAVQGCKGIMSGHSYHGRERSVSDAYLAFSPDGHRVENRILGRLLLLLRGVATREDLPETQGLICSGGDDGSAIWALRHVQDARSMASELGNLDHRGVLPQDELVVRVTMRRD